MIHINKKNLLQALGVFGTISSITIYLSEPSFPTPDKLFIVGIFVAMIFSQAIQLIKRFSPFILVILIYESFRGVADYLNQNVNFTPMIEADKFLFFGHLPTKILQNILWHGNVKWYDFGLYLAYMLHFVLPLGLAVIIWKKFNDKLYWRFVWTFAVLMLAGFLTYIIFPAAPPWMASDLGYIEPITRISSDVWFALGVNDFPSLYNKIAPNPVAAVPSLHAAFSFLFAIFVTTIFKSKWRHMAWIYPVMIVFGTVYMGEHYIVDAILGILYAGLAFKYTPALQKNIVAKFHKLAK
jgi:hypothetical protein